MRPVPKPEIVRDEGFKAWIRTLPCLLWEREPPTCGGFLRLHTRRYATECAHVRVRRHGDKENCVPLCHKHHVEHDQNMGPKSFEKHYEIQLKPIAIELWREYRERHAA